MRWVNSNIIVKTIYETLIAYPVYLNINYWWNFGVLAFICLMIQIITGIFLAMHYIPSSDMAFFSIEHIMRDINYGWLMRYIHANGASFFFAIVYIHICRGFYYKSFLKPRSLLWMVGVLILFLMIVTAFLGYILPWGQMSFWAATVITSLISAIPKIGDFLLIWIWGGFSVNSATLNRFFSLHYLLPFVILAFSVVHVIFLHDRGSTNPLGIYLNKDKIPFHPYFTWKDIYSIFLFFIVFFIFIFFFPNKLGHPDNYILANPLSTPSHIVPEWYFLPFYAILRSVPNKLGGILILLFAILLLFILPFIVNYKYKGTIFQFYYKLFFWFFVFLCLFLGWLGGCPIEYPYFELSQICTFLYFFYLLFILNFLSYIIDIINIIKKYINV